MSSMTLFISIVCIIALLFLLINLMLAPHNPYQEKYSIFECGFHSFLGQNRTQFAVKFFIFALVFLLLDLEIVLIFPYSLSAQHNGFYGLMVLLGFILIITIGFVYEVGKGALHIDSRQTTTLAKVISSYNIGYIGKSKLINNSLYSKISVTLFIKNFILKFNMYFANIPFSKIIGLLALLLPFIGFKIFFKNVCPDILIFILLPLVSGIQALLLRGIPAILDRSISDNPDKKIICINQYTSIFILSYVVNMVLLLIPYCCNLEFAWLLSYIVILGPILSPFYLSINLTYIRMIISYINSKLKCLFFIPNFNYKPQGMPLMSSAPIWWPVFTGHMLVLNSIGIPVNFEGYPQIPPFAASHNQKWVLSIDYTAMGDMAPHGTGRWMLYQKKR